MKYLNEDATYIYAECEHCGRKLKVGKVNGKILGDYFVLDYPMNCACGYLDKNIKNIKKSKPVQEVRKNEDKKEVDEIKCPKCGSKQITAKTKGFGLGKAVVGAALLGSVGLLGGVIGSKKIIVVCLNCGHEWQAGGK